MMGRRRNRQFSFIIFLGVILIFIQLIYLTDHDYLKKENRIYSSLNISLIINGNNLVSSICSIRATKRGSGQKIIAISFFGPIENPKMFSLKNSFILLEEFINELQQIYPDNWILRIYHNKNIFNQTIISYYESRYNFIDFCNITEINLDFIPPRMWRFLPAIDETVNIMASRDLDSPLTQRERAAIDEWILSNLTFHSMRDHSHHSVPILAGMWAFRVEYDRSFSNILRTKIFNHSLVTQYSLNRDQYFLDEHLWLYARNNAMVHASHWCVFPDWNKHHRPFPTQRPLKNSTNYCFIGCPKPCCINEHLNQKPCPIECRPKEHQDWIYC